MEGALGWLMVEMPWTRGTEPQERTKCPLSLLPDKHGSPELTPSLRLSCSNLVPSTTSTKNSAGAQSHRWVGRASTSAPRRTPQAQLSLFLTMLIMDPLGPMLAY